MLLARNRPSFHFHFCLFDDNRSLSLIASPCTFLNLWLLHLILFGLLRFIQLIGLSFFLSLDLIQNIPGIFNRPQYFLKGRFIPYLVFFDDLPYVLIFERNKFILVDNRTRFVADKLDVVFLIIDLRDLSGPRKLIVADRENYIVFLE